MNRKTIGFWTVAVLTIVFDQATKWWVYLNLKPRDEIEVIAGWFSIVHAQNPGAALGLLRDFEYRYFVFIGFTIVAVVVILNMQRQLADSLRFIPSILGLIFGGAIGNGIDRIHKQTVTDFLRVYTEHPKLQPFLVDWFGTNEYPSFNVADAALVIGVALFVVHYLFLDEGELEGKAAPEPAPQADDDEHDAFSSGDPDDTPTDPGGAEETVRVVREEGMR